MTPQDDEGLKDSEGSETETGFKAGREHDAGGEQALPPSPEDLEEAKEEALDFLEGLLDAMELEGDVDVDISEGGLEAVIEGRDAGVLIGRRGQTMSAIQELLRISVQRMAKSRLRITLDIEGYRDRRRAALEKMAHEMAEVALREGEVELDPMTAYERKIIHDAIGPIEGVQSFSEGEEPKRRVILQSEE